MRVQNIIVFSLTRYLVASFPGLPLSCTAREEEKKKKKKKDAYFSSSLPPVRYVREEGLGTRLDI